MRVLEKYWLASELVIDRKLKGAIQDALMSAESNAGLTQREHPKEIISLEETAEGSISSTDAFDTNLQVRAWFESHGYTW